MAPDPSPSLALTLEVWTWLLALAVVFWSVLRDAEGDPHLGPEEFFVLALVGYNLTVNWLLGGRGRPERRLSCHLFFLTAAIGLLELSTHGDNLAHVFGGLLVVIPSLGARALGNRLGAALLGFAAAMVSLSELKGWLVDSQPVALAFGELGLELLILALGAGMALRNASELRELVRKLAARSAELTRAKESIRESEEKFRSAFAHAAIGKALVASDGGRFLAVNEALCRMLGYSESELLGMDADALVHPADQPSARHVDAQVMVGGLPCYRGERRYLNRLGQVVWAQVTVSPIRDATGQPTCFITEIQDITERKEFEAQLAFLADHDPLTNLYNRRRFQRELGRHLELAASGGGQGAVVFLDLDRFKQINDTLGHQAGDQVLTMIAASLRKRLREDDVLARLGGDEFAVLLPGVGPGQARKAAAQVLRTVAGEALLIEGQTIQVTASMGVALYPRDGADPEELLSRADIALFEAKNNRNCFAFYEPGSARELSAAVERRWENDIREALRDGRLVLLAQPIMNLRTAEIACYELLLRLLDQNGQLIPPATFLGVAERSGLIGEIDRWVVRAGMAALSAVDQAGCRSCRLEINLSARALTDPDFSTFIAQQLAVTGIDPSRLVLEITETAAIANLVEARQFVLGLKQFGFRFALDDFGSGHSSFAHLKNLPIDFLKIDGGYIKDVRRNEIDRHLVAAMVGMAHALGLGTIAEFVEDAETLSLLKDLGCDYAQGFHIGVPRDVTEAVAAFRSTRQDVPAT